MRFLFDVFLFTANAPDHARVDQRGNGVISHVRLARAQSRTLLRQRRLFVVKKTERF
jgi:hypothetical protein